ALLPASVGNSQGIDWGQRWDGDFHFSVSAGRGAVHITVNLPGTFSFPIVRGVSEVWFVALAMLAPLLWPWLTFLALLVFQTTLGLAKLGASHIARCVVYCGDLTLWVGLLVLLGGIAA